MSSCSFRFGRLSGKIPELAAFKRFEGSVYRRLTRVHGPANDAGGFLERDLQIAVQLGADSCGLRRAHARIVGQIGNDDGRAGRDFGKIFEMRIGR